MGKSRSIEKLFLAFALCFFFEGQAFAMSEKTFQNLKYLSQNIDQIIGIEILIAAPKDDQPESRFGHSMLRFVMNSGDAFQDPVLTFIAETGPEEKSIRKGLTGGYPVMAEIGNMSEIYLSYLGFQERPIRRLVLPSTSENRHQLVHQLLRWEKHPEQMGNYWFVGQNCTNVLFIFLKSAGFRISNTPVAIPTLVQNILVEQLVTALPVIETINPLSEKQRAKTLDELKRLPTRDLQRIFSALSYNDDDQLLIPLVDLIAERKDRVSLNEVYNLTPLPFQVYQLCAHECRTSEFQKVVLENFPKQDLVQLYRGASSLYRASQLAGASSTFLEPSVLNFRRTQKILCDAYGKELQNRPSNRLCAF